MNKLIIALVFLFCGTVSFAQIYVPPTPTVYGQNTLRDKAFLARHIPEKTDTVTNTNDTTAQIFLLKSDSSVWAYYKPRGFFQIGSGGGSSFALDSIYVYGLIDTNMTLHPGHVSIFVPVSILDSLKHQFIDTAGGMTDGYVLTWDNPDRKWILAPGGGGGSQGLQDVITNDPSLTVNNIITFSSHELKFEGSISSGIGAGNSNGINIQDSIGFGYLTVYGNDINNDVHSEYGVANGTGLVMRSSSISDPSIESNFTISPSGFSATLPYGSFGVDSLIDGPGIGYVLMWDRVNKQILKYPIDSINGGGGTTIYTGNGSLPEERVIDINGNAFRIINGSNGNQMVISPTHSTYTSTDNIADAGLTTQGIYTENNVFNALFADDGVKATEIFQRIDTLTHTSYTNIFSDAIKIHPSGDNEIPPDYFFQINDGTDDLYTIDITGSDPVHTFKGLLGVGGTPTHIFDVNDGLGTSYFYLDANNFNLTVIDGANSVGISGNATSNTMNYVANAHAINGTSSITTSAPTNSYQGSTWDWNDGGSTHYMNISSSGVQIDQAYLLPGVDGSANQFMQTDGSGHASWQSIDTTLITNFAPKVHSLFSASSPLAYNSGTGLFSITAMDATHAGYVAAGGSAGKILHGDGTWKDSVSSSLFVKLDGTTPLTGNWNYGTSYIEARQTATSSATVTDGIKLRNTTAATVGAQMWSPYLYFEGQGWSTTSTASQSAIARIGLQPIQGTTNPTWEMTVGASLNGGAYGTPLLLTSSGNLTLSGAISTPSSITSSKSGGGANANDGMVLTNSTAATVGAQQWSTAIRMRGNGWGTTGSASQTVDYRQYITPVQGTVPSGLWTLESSINGGAYANPLTYSSAGGLSAASLVLTGNVNCSQVQSTSWMRATTNGVGTTQNDGLVSTNATASTVGVPQQYTGVVRMTGTAWTGAASQNSDWIIQNRPINGTSPITSKLVISSQINAAGYIDVFSITDLGKPMLLQTITAGGTTGNQTINKATGTVNIAAAGTTVTVTNSLCTTSSIVYAVLRTNDGTATGVKNVVPSNGSFIITLNAAATAEVSVGFIVFD